MASEPATGTTTISVAVEDAAYNPDWLKSQNPASSNPEILAASMSTSATAPATATATTTTVSSSVVSDASQMPSHSDFYVPQPTQASEADEIARLKEEAEKKKGNKGMGAAVGGAAAVAGIAGLCLVGPIVGVAAAGGAAYVAATNKGAAGTVMRASGTATSAVASSARNFDKKHHVVSKTGRGIAGGVGWIAGKVRRNKQQQPQV